MLDAVVVRTAGPLTDLRELACLGRLPVVNAMATEEHPTQAVCDVATLTLSAGGADLVLEGPAPWRGYKPE